MEDSWFSNDVARWPPLSWVAALSPGHSLPWQLRVIWHLPVGMRSQPELFAQA